MPDEPTDPFALPMPTSKPAVPFSLPIQWRTRDPDVYWINDGDLIHPLATMPLRRAERLLACLEEQARTDLVAAFRDLPLLAAVRRHIDRLTG